jgi:glycerate 2-kinase
VKPDALRADALACWTAALAAVEPTALVRRCLVRERDVVRLVDRAGTRCAEHRGPVVVVGAGKAAIAMTRAVAGVVRDRLEAGLVIVPHGAGGEAGPVAVAFGGHPVPDAAGAAATARLLALVRDAGPGTLVVFALSGGASSLLVAPAAGLTADDEAGVSRALLASGADIAAMNAVRKHCSAIKGGGLARAARGAAALWTLALSDVAGDDPAVIGSGPTVPDPTTFADAAAVLARWLAPGDVPPAVAAHVAAGVARRVPDTAKPGDPAFARAVTVVVGGNCDAVDAAARAACARGYAVDVVPEPIAGDAADAGRALAARLRAAPRERPAAVVAGGEPTVRVRPGGRGGRAQHLALAAASALAGEPAVLLAAGTDGVDGPTDAAGACVDGGTIARAAGVDPERALAATDSHRALLASGDLLRTGPTGTNVADVVVGLRAAC